MIRLEPWDLVEPDRLDRLAQAAGLTPDEFGREFASTVDLASVETPA
jgi:hypothetical protein